MSQQQTKTYKDGFQEIKPKRQGPRGQKIQQRKMNDKPNDKPNVDSNGEKRLSFKELMFELNNLRKHKNSPRVDLWEETENDKKFYIVRMELPGIDEYNMKVLDSQFLLVTAFKKHNKIPEKDIVYTECSYDKIVRRVKVKNLVYNKLESSYIDGVLEISLEQKEQNTSKQMPPVPPNSPSKSCVDEVKPKINISKSPRCKSWADGKSWADDPIDPIEPSESKSWADEPVESKSWADII